MSFEKLDIACHVEHGFWGETYDRWRKEGLDSNVQMPRLWEHLSGLDLFKYYGILKFGYIRPGNYMYPGFEHTIIEDNEDFIIERNSNGVTTKTSKKSISLPQYLDYPIKCREDYEKYKEQLTGNTYNRYPDNWSEVAKAMREQAEIPVCTHMDGFFAYPRELMGIENTLMMFYDDPGLMKDIINDRVDFYMDLYEKAIKDTKPDFAFIWEDMCFKNGPLVSPAIFREFMLPAYRELTSYLGDMGVEKVIVDSDGDVMKLIPLWLEGGVSGLLPFEVKSGMDVVKIGEEFPELIIFGGIDKHHIAKGHDAIDFELNRILPAMIKRGGYFVSLDHWVPPEISLSDFNYYADKVKTFKL